MFEFYRSQETWEELAERSEDWLFFRIHKNLAPAMRSEVEKRWPPEDRSAPFNVRALRVARL